jgi:hypothetical protein
MAAEFVEVAQAAVELSPREAVELRQALADFLRGPDLALNSPAWRGLVQWSDRQREAG